MTLAPIKVVIVAADPLVMQALRGYCEGAAISVVGTCPTPADILPTCAQHNPDVLVSDVEHPESCDYDILRAVQTLANPPALVAVSSLTAPEALETILALGATAVIAKNDPPELYPLIIGYAHQKIRWLTPSASEVLIAALADSTRRAKVDANLSDASTLGLTPTEIRVLDLVYQGLSNAQIQDKTGMGLSSVKKYVSSLLRKYGVDSRSQLCAKVRALETTGFSGDPHEKQ